jgi:hypothetical protein
VDPTLIPRRCDPSTDSKVIEVFRDTLVPASLVGLATKLTGLILSGHMGGLVDRYPRLQLIRCVIAAEKVSSGDRQPRGELRFS